MKITASTPVLGWFAVAFWPEPAWNLMVLKYTLRFLKGHFQDSVEILLLTLQRFQRQKLILFRDFCIYQR